MTKKDTRALAPVAPAALAPLVQHAMSHVREEMQDNPYIEEALRVLTVQGYRSAIGCFWNAVVDDLRNKVIFRSLSLFNKSVSLGREVKSYEDFQNFVTDDVLIDGAYKIGVIDWEAHKVLKHAKDTRHIFDGHPRSSEPSPFKVLAMIEDCTKYVLQVELPAQIIDIDEYITVLGNDDFDRSEVAIENALGDLPDTYKNELINRLFTAYIHPDASSVLRGNTEFISPFLWEVLPKSVKVQVVRRVDREIPKGVSAVVENAFAFVKIVKGNRYLSTLARKYKINPLISKLVAGLDDFDIENQMVRELYPYRSLIPAEVMPQYVSAITQTFVGHVGFSSRFSRTDFYADKAAAFIPQMFETFDDAAAAAFVDGIKENRTLRDRIRNEAKLARLRSLAKIALDRVSDSFADKKFLAALADEEQEELFLKLLKS
jgi:hypothetical protein